MHSKVGFPYALGEAIGVPLYLWEDPIRIYIHS